MRIEHEIKQARFDNQYQKLAINLAYTQAHFNHLWAKAFKNFKITPEQYNVLRILKGSHPKPMGVKDIKEKGGERMAWVDSLSNNNVKIISILEVIAAIGLILPQVTGVLPWLTPLAAVGLVLTMIGAMALHAKRGDGAPAIITNAVLLLIAAFVAFGRFVLVPA